MWVRHHQFRGSDLQYIATSILTTYNIHIWKIEQWSPTFKRTQNSSFLIETPSSTNQDLFLYCRLDK